MFSHSKDMRRIKVKTKVSELDEKRRKIQRENEKILHPSSEENLFHSTFKAFASNTSIHAIHYLIEESIRMIEKLLWLLIIFMASLAMVYCCILLSNRFQSSLTATVFESTSYQVAEIPFPGIILCDNNRMNNNLTDDAIAKFFPHRTENETKIFVKFLRTLQDMDYGSFSEWEAIIDYGYNGAMDKLNVTKIYEFMMHQCQNFLLECRWRKKPLECCKIFTRQKTEYGLCWAFNSMSSEGNAGNNVSNPFPWRVHKAGRKSALEVRKFCLILKKYVTQFFINKFQVLMKAHTFTPQDKTKHGILALIQHPQEYPSNGLFVAAKSITSLVIKPTAFSTSDDVSGLAPDDRQCYYDVI